MVTAQRAQTTTNEPEYRLASRGRKPEGSVFTVRGQAFGGEALQLIAGPCTVESRAQILEIAYAVQEAGATALRGGAFKPRTSPYSFQGHALRALEWLAEAREATGLLVVTELLDPAMHADVAEVADILQLGSRSMQNFALLRAVSTSHRPVLLKRGMCNTLEEFLLAAEYVLQGGNGRVLLCERGIRTFSQETRNTFDLNAIPALKQLSHLPVLADPSHATGKREYVASVARGALAAGADGLLVEVHPDPMQALSDGRQSLYPEQFAALVHQIKRLAPAIDRSLAGPGGKASL